MVRRLNSVMEKEGHLLPDWIETMRAEVRQTQEVNTLNQSLT